jgi:hypothetical protein
MANQLLKDKVAKAFDKVRNKFFDAGTVAEFIKPNAARDDYQVVETFHEDWWLEYDNFNRNFTFEVIEAEFFAATVAEATHLRIKSPSGNGTIYKIDRRTIEPPDGAEVTWRFRCDRVLTSNLRYQGLGA